MVIWDGINFSPHQPVLLSIEAKCAYKNVKIGHNNDKAKCSWQKANDAHLNNYRNRLDEFLKQI